MKEYIKSYHLFLSSPVLRWIVYLVYPLLFLCGFFFLDHQIAHISLLQGHHKTIYLTLIFTITNLVLGFELITDFFSFGGISSKETNKLEYLKTSPKGIFLLRKSLIWDGIRRLLSLILIVGVCSCCSAPTYTFSDAFGITFLLFTFIEAALTVTRHFSMIIASLLAYSVTSLILPSCTVLLQDAPLPLKIILPVLTGIVAAFLNRWLILRKARNSYYDDRTEKSI